MTTLVLAAFLNHAAAAETRLLVQVTDAEGKPIPTAIVRFAEEGERHRVNSFDGSWEGSVLIPSPDVTKPMIKGDEYHMDVMASGYAYTTQAVAITNKMTKVHVTLSPISYETPADASAEESATYAALRAWTEADAAYAKNPTEDAQKTTIAARADVSAAAHAWITAKPEGSKATLALDACRAASQRSTDCD